MGVFIELEVGEYIMLRLDFGLVRFRALKVGNVRFYVQGAGLQASKPKLQNKTSVNDKPKAPNPKNLNLRLDPRSSTLNPKPQTF